MDLISTFSHQYTLLKSRFDHLEQVTNSLNELSCCPNCSKSISQLLYDISKDKQKELKTFYDAIDIANFKSGMDSSDNIRHYGDNIMQPYKVCVKGFRNLSNIYNCLCHHLSACKSGNINSRSIHEIQRFQDDCVMVLSKIRGFSVWPSLLIPSYNPTPTQITTYSPINITSIPYIDLGCPITWPVMAHETVHAVGKFASMRPEDKWMDEFKCDFFATLAIGPAYLLSYLLTYGSIPGRAKFKDEKIISHPFPEHRITLCVEVLKEFLGYEEDFVEGWMKKIYEYIYFFESDSSETSTENVEGTFRNQIRELIDGFKVNTEFKENVSQWGFTYDKFKEYKVSNISNPIVKAKKIIGRTPVTLMNGLIYGIVRHETDITDPDMHQAFMESLKNSVMTTDS